MAGFHKPTTTQTPDALFDYWQTRLTKAEMRVLLYAVRRTFGFKKDDDDISLDQFVHGITTREGEILDEGCGISRSTLLSALKKLVGKGLLIKDRRTDRRNADEANNYRLDIVDPRRPRAMAGFRTVNTTQVPDELFDYWLSRLTDPELFVLLYIIRRTLGFGKRTDIISPDQFLHGIRTKAGTVLDEGCGLSNKSLYAGIAGLRERGLITVERRMHHRKGNLASRFGLVFTGDVPYVLLEEVDPRLQACMGGAEHDLDADVFCPNDDVEDPTTTADHSRGKGVERARRPHEDGEGGPDGEAGDHVKGDRSLHQGGPIDTKRGVGSYSNGAWMLHQGRAHGTSREGAAYVEGEQCVHQAFVSVSTPQQTDPEQDTVKQQTDDQHMGMSKVSRSTTTRDKMNTARSRAETGLRLYSPAIADRIEDWSIEFHDKDHFIQNRTQIMRKWIESGLGEGQFVELMYEARRRAKKALVTKDATDGPSTYGGVKNRMPYFFKTLQDLVDNGLGTGDPHDDGARDTDHSARDDAPGQAVHDDGSGQPARVGVPADPMEAPESRAWRSVCAELRGELSPENYARWFTSTAALALDGGRLIVGVPDAFHLQWLDRRLRGVVERAAARVLAGVAVAFVLDL